MRNLNLTFCGTATAAALLALSTGCASTSPRSDIVRGNKIIEFHHLDQKGEYIHLPGTKESSTLKPGAQGADIPSIRMRPGERPSFSISDPNPVLFTYTPGQISSTPTATFSTASSLATALSTFSTNIAGRGRDGATCSKFEIQGVDIEEFFKSTAELLKTADTLKEVVAKTLDQSEQNMAALRQRVADWKLAKIKATVTAGLAAVDATWAARLRGQTIAVTIPGAATCPTSTLAQGFDAVPGSALYRGAWDMFLDLRSDAKDLRNLLITLESLATQIGKIGIPQPLESQLRYSGTLVQIQPIVVGVSSEFSPYLNDEARDIQKKRSGTYNISVEPFEGFHLAPSAGVIYSFVNAPTFAAKANGSGQFTITKTSNEYAKLGSSIAANLIWDEFFGQPVEPFIQIGVSPDNDNLALLAGVGIKAVDRFTFGAGVAYQRVKQLSAGQTVGATIASAEDLKTDSKFKSGLYLTISYKLKD